MPEMTTPDIGNSVDDVLRLELAEQASWPLVPIPAWHPRNEETAEERAAREAAAAGDSQVDWDSADNPYVQRTREQQAGYTKSQQELAAERAVWEDDEALLERIRQARPHLLAEEAQQFSEDPYAERWARLEAAEARIAEHDSRVAAENAAAGEELFHQDLDEWATEAGEKLTPADHNAIFGLLMKAPDPTQESAAKAIFEAHVAAKKAEREQWQTEYEQTRKRPRVPHTPGGNGAANTAVPDFSQMSRAEIDKYMAEQVMGS